MGYEAAPVLVATGFQQKLPSLLPAPDDFDHVIVRAVADGRTYWLDPTRSHQRGPAAQLYLPAYAFGLAAKRGETQLTRIPFSHEGAPETFTSEVFHLGGQKEPAKLSVITTFTGFDAEWMRAIVSAEGRDRLAKDYLNDYAQRYPEISIAAPLVVEDSPDWDRLTMTRSYYITNFWTLSADKQS
jgi:hypothetical protein